MDRDNMTNQKALVIHNTLNSVGGGERVSLAVIEALKKAGYEVHLLTTEPTDWNKVEKIIGRVVKPDNEINVLPFKVRMFGIYMRLLTFARMLRMKKKYDLTVNTHGDVLPVSTDIIYMHYPTFVLARENPVNIKYSKSMFWNLYFKPYEWVEGWIARGLKNKKSLVLTNSHFSADAIRRYIGVEPIIVYPPVNINEFKIHDGKREKIVISCGRFTPEKNYETVIEIAGLVPQAKFKIIGASSGTVSSKYIEKLKRLASEHSLFNIEFLINLPRKEQVNLYRKASVFLHTMVQEHFGIAVVEAMASGLYPVVHKSGGSWTDIVRYGKYGCGFNTEIEGMKCVEYGLYAVSNRNSLLEQARKFSKEQFIEKILDIISGLK